MSAFASALPQAVALPTPQSDVFVVTAGRARMVRTLLTLIEAYDATALSDALALVADNVVWTDCDYAAGAAVEVRGKSNLREYLAKRSADHDHIEIGTLWNLNPEPATNATVGLTIARRTSDTLAHLRFKNGIVGSVSIKVNFITDDRIGGFVGASANQPQECRPR